MHVQFDHTINSIEETGNNQLKANLVKPENWELVINKANNLMRESNSGLMFFSSALNLPLASSTYAGQLIDKFQQMFEENTSITYVFCISTSMLADKAKEIENMADNLMQAYVTSDSKKLHFDNQRVNKENFSSGVLDAPFTEEQLKEAEQRAQKYRVAPLNSIKKI